MDKFYAQCGDFIAASQRAEGAFPKTRYIACFTYKHGYAEYDGEGWQFTLRNVRP